MQTLVWGHMGCMPSQIPTKSTDFFQQFVQVEKISNFCMIAPLWVHYKDILCICTLLAISEEYLIQWTYI